MPTPMIDTELRKHYTQRLGAMQKERSSFIPHYRELAEFIQPRRGRFLISDRNKGERRHQSIINSRASRAHRIARSGMFAGVMSPARPWFKLETPDPDMMRYGRVKDWLYQVETLLRTIFDQSNLYNAAPTMLGELLLFATGAMAHVDDFDKVARFHTYPAGSYMIAQDDRHKINTFVREFEMTVGQLVSMFGLDNVSQSVKNLYNKGTYDSWYKVVNFIDPNPAYRETALESEFKRFRSVYFEPEEAEGKLLMKSGFDEFPVYTPRWETTGEDIYGTNCPAMESLGDIKGLQIMERRKSQAVDKLVNPPLMGPPSLKNVPVSSLPGGVTIYDSDPNNILRPIYQIDPRVGELRLDIQAVEQRINENFFVDMFMAISAMPGIQPKNELELSQRNEERLLQLGPTLEQLHGDFLSPLVDRTFNQLARRGLLPEPPPELEGTPLKVRFVSVLALAQRALELSGIERFTNFVGAVAHVKQSALDKYDEDEAIDQYGQLLGVMPSIIVDQEAVEQIREQRAQHEAQMLQAEQAQMETKAVQQGAAALKQGADAEKSAAEAKANEQ